MSGVTKNLRVGDYLNSMLLHFSTPELRDLHRVSRQKIADFTKSYMQGNGCNTALIIFDLFDFTFILKYDYKAREWVLELDDSMGYPPPANTKPPRRRSQSKSNGSTRAAQSAIPARRRRPPRAVLRTWARVVMRKISQSAAYKMWMAFLDDVETRPSMDLARREEITQFQHELSLLKVRVRACVQRTARLTERAAACVRSGSARRTIASLNGNSPTLIEMFAQLQDSQPSFGERRLVRRRLSGPLAFIGDLFSFERQSFEGPWDSSWFGELPQPSEQTGR